MASLSQFFGGSKGGQSGGIGQYGVGLATGFTSQLPIDLMVIGGGGGGGGAGQQAFAGVATNFPTANADRFMAGGGGSGRGLIYTNLVVDVGTTYPITVGAGGAENSRGGTSSFGFIRAGGGGAGGGVTPAGVAVTPDFGGLYGGNQGGSAFTAAGALSVGGGVGVAPFADTLYSDATPLNGYSNASNLFKQAINSQVYPSITFNFLTSPLSQPSSQAGNGGGTGDIGSSPGSAFPGVSETELFGRWDLPALITPAPRSYFTHTTYSLFQANGYAPANIATYNVYSTIPAPSYAPLGLHPTWFPAITPASYGPGILGRFFPGNTPANNLITGIDRAGVPITPANVVIPVMGGDFTSPVFPCPAQPNFPFLGTIPAQTTKGISSYGITPFSFNGSPGNGGGGSGGLRHPPLVMQGTYTARYTCPNPVTTIRTAPYVYTIPASTAPMASGGAGGSGSVWVIYPSDYAAATVTGNTPVPSPPAIRVYRWDGAGTIKFNAS